MDYDGEEMYVNLEGIEYSRIDRIRWVSFFSFTFEVRNSIEKLRIVLSRDGFNNVFTFVESNIWGM